MKKYILNIYNKILTRRKATQADVDLGIWYNVQGPVPCKDIELGEDFYAFVFWSHPTTNVFSEKDYLLKDSVKKETNNFFRYLYWRIKYRKDNKLEKCFWR